MSEQKTINEIVREAKPGAIFVPSDFAEAGAADAVRKALSRMVESGELERPMRGLYRKPRRSAFLDKPVPASPNEIAEALARKFDRNGEVWEGEVVAAHDPDAEPRPFSSREDLAALLAA